MIKVIIADDEERICQLIEALADWKALGMEIEGVAHNGLEACEMVKKIRPDILITDIRMPGCSGLELISRVKEELPGLEIIIISGYAHFEYAQQAIRYGVGHYLLKPINKAELVSTLEKLRDRIGQKRNTEESKQELLRKVQKDDLLLRQNLMERLIRGEELMLSEEILREVYHLQVGQGRYQCFYLKMDSQGGELSRDAAKVLMDKGRELLQRSLRGRCMEMVLTAKDLGCVGIVNYREGEQEEIRKALRDCLTHMEVQKNLFQPVSFSMALGGAYNQAKDLGRSVKEAFLLIQERLLKGSGRLWEHLGEPSGFSGESLLERYLRLITHAVEVLSEQEADEAVELLRQEVQAAAGIRGYELLELVFGAADIFAVRIQLPERNRQAEEFQKACRQYGSAGEVFEELAGFQRRELQRLNRKHENDAIRPVRNAKQYIQNHFSEPITLEEVSEKVGLSTTYFSALFKRTEGEGFAKYLINVRMEQAKILLRETNLPVTEICRKVGYNDVKHFTHTFEKATGVKPSVYRKLYG